MADNSIYQYIVVIKNRHNRFVNLTGFFLSFGSAVLFLREMVIQNKIIPVYLAGVAFITGIIIWNLFKIKNQLPVHFSKALLIAAIVWTKMPYLQFMVFVFAALALFEYQAKHALEIGFSDKQIVFNTLIKKKYSWKDIDNVVLKDGLLTIDFKNNKLFQKEIDGEDKEADEEEFNNWVREMGFLNYEL